MLGFSKIIDLKHLSTAVSEQFLYSFSNFLLIFSVGFFLSKEALVYYTIVILVFNLFCLLLNSTIFGYLNSRDKTFRDSVATAYIGALRKRKKILYSIGVFLFIAVCLFPDYLSVPIFILAVSFLEVHRRFGLLMDSVLCHFFAIPAIRFLLVIFLALSSIDDIEKMFPYFALLCLIAIAISLQLVKRITVTEAHTKVDFPRGVSLADSLPLLTLFAFGALNWTSGMFLLNKASSYFSAASIGDFLYLKNFFSIASFILPIFDNYFVKNFKRFPLNLESSITFVVCTNLFILSFWSFLVFYALGFFGQAILKEYAVLIFAVFAVEVMLSGLVGLARLTDKFVILAVVAACNLLVLLWMSSLSIWSSVGGLGVPVFLGQQNVILVLFLSIFLVARYGKA